jgi:hypothetical protein
MPASFKTNPISLEELIKDCEAGKIQLPDFQRSWVWHEDQIRSVIASISQGFPVGALMSLETGGGVADNFARRPIQGALPEADARIPDQLLLDGQQRMTSLFQTCRRQQPVETVTARKKRVSRWFYLDIVNALDARIDREATILTLPKDKILRTNFDKDIVLDISTRELEYEHMMFPATSVFDWDDWQDGFGDYWQERGELAERRAQFRDFKETVLQNFKQYQLPVIALGKDASREAVCLVFEKVNTGGKPLDAFELLTAIYAAEGHTLRDDWLGTSNDEGIQTRLRTYSPGNKKFGVLEKIDSTDLLQACALLHTKAVRQTAIEAGEPQDKWPAVRATRQSLLNLPLKAYIAYRDRVVDGFEAAVRLLRSLYIYKAIDLPYQSQIIALATIYAEIGPQAENAAVREKLIRWFWCGVFGELYGSASESRIARDIVDVPVWLIGGAEPSSVIDGVMRTDRLRSMRSRQSAAYKGVHALLMKEGALDFRSGERFEQAKFFDAYVDIHHIFPQAWCKKQKIEASVFDSVINKTPLSYKTNRSIGSRAPSVYLHALEKGSAEQAGLPAEQLEALLESHRINNTTLRADDFAAFYDAREAALLSMISAATGHRLFVAESAEEGEDSDEDDPDLDLDEEAA